MLLKIQGYNFDMVYRPGEQMNLADTLSRLPNPENDQDIELDERVDGLEIEAEAQVIRTTIATMAVYCIRCV